MELYIRNQILKSDTIQQEKIVLGQVKTAKAKILFQSISDLLYSLEPKYKMGILSNGIWSYWY